MSQIKTLLSQLANRFTAISLATLATALLAYFRSEVAAATKWFLDPLTSHFPWHRSTAPRTRRATQKLSSELTVADVFLSETNGRTSTYEKTGNYIVAGAAVSSYFEGVTTSGSAHGFSTEIGAVVDTTREHGFYVSTIDLGSVFTAGARFRNLYRVSLDDSFTSEEEHWTQEIACPTEHLTLRIHFPVGRPPKLVRCKQIIGLTETLIPTGALITHLFDRPAIVWDIDQPRLHDIYKLEWRW
jgi:hypothetical protein